MHRPILFLILSLFLSAFSTDFASAQTLKIPYVSISGFQAPLYLGERADGYHDLRTIFQTLALCDRLTITRRRGPFELTCDTPGVPTDQGNLVWKAASLLLRLHDTQAQSGLGRAQRLRNLQGALAVDPLRASSLQGRSVLLVDDVMTTGATLQAAATALRQAGASAVSALVFARTPAPE